MRFIEFGQGFSDDDNPLKAGAHATSNALKQLKYSERPNVIFLFSSPDYDPEEILNGVKLITNTKTPIVGGSSRFQIVNNELLKNGVGVGILSSKYINVGVGVGLGVSINPKESGKKAISDAMKNLSMVPKFVMVFIDYCKFEEEVLKGITEVLGITIPIFGGTTTDNFEFKKTYQYCNDVYFDSVVCVAFGGDILPKMAYGNYSESNKQSKPYKPYIYNDIEETKTVITETNKRYIYKLNSINALDYYKNISKFNGSYEELQKDRQFYLSHAFGLLNANGEIILKGPISIKNGVLICGSNVIERNELKMVNITNEKIKELFRSSTNLLINTTPKYESPLTFCCSSTYLPEISEESVKDSLKSCPLNLFGFSTYGEITLRDYMNYTVSMCSIVPDLASISAKDGIHMVTKYPATKETILKINEMGGEVKIEELARALNIHRRTAYDRIEPLLQYGFVEKEHALIKITDFGRLLLKLWI
ncbi:FIST N-terminal domain-containing protein [Methanothermococcus okinawensis]|uniref:Transcriptional regulator, TrmB n=1 Tax=Methanothermococcus okinawensis (strain DSM 14208 / JCM 11175 / IH1) TaxID=647113 RepID=F8AN87_METOI|nr:FIST N-terminal domain-containing protein [Methanothermococcus okinawensis]AEH07008.1 transcriptional regulator, TrmB [Methanothermococcus okinawensis IH1]